MIDYTRMNREAPKLKGALTRATRSGDIVKVLDAIERAIEVWDEVGAWPDDWSRWARALDDAWFRFCRTPNDRYDEAATLDIGDRVHLLHDRF